MISIELARKLKKAGVEWTPQKNDFFMVPDRGLDDSIFVLNDMAVFIVKRHGVPTVTFHGTPEWALDDILVTEVVWLPTETQVRSILEAHLVTEPEPALKLESSADGYLCQVQFRGENPQFEAFGASDAYGLALLHILKSQNS